MAREVRRRPPMALMVVLGGVAACGAGIAIAGPWLAERLLLDHAIEYRSELVYRCEDAEPRRFLDALEPRLRAFREHFGVVHAVVENDELLVRFRDEPGALDLAFARRLVESERVFQIARVVDDDLDGFHDAVEREKLREWWHGRTDPSLRAYEAVPREAGGPDPRVRWLQGVGGKAGDVPGSAVPTLRPGADVGTIDERDLVAVEPTLDEVGRPAVGFTLRAEAASSSSPLSTSRRAAVLVLGEIVMAPYLAGGGPFTTSILEPGAQLDAGFVADLLEAREPLPGPLRFIELRRTDDP